MEQTEQAKQTENEIKEIIRKCDLAIKDENFDLLMQYYTEDAILVVKPGTIAQGKEQIKKAFVAIAKYFNNSLVPTQGEMIVLAAGDTALVLSQSLLDANKEDSEFAMERRATFVFRKEEKWLCAIDNSYGTDLISNAIQ